MRNTLIVVFTLLTCINCGLSQEQEKVAEALEKTIAALEAKDIAALWKMSTPHDQQQVLDLFQKMHRAGQLIDELYPEDQRAKARSAIGWEMISNLDPKDEALGPKLLARFVKPETLRLDAAARDSLLHRGAAVKGDTAIIQTTRDESFSFRRTAEGWRSSLIADLLIHNPNIQDLRDNIDAIIKAGEARKKERLASRDPRSPIGAYNLIREALKAKPMNIKVVYTLLDVAGRRAAENVLRTARQIQKALPKTMPKAKRQKLYKKYGIARYAKLTKDIAVIEHWAAQPKFISPLPSLSPPEKLEPGKHGHQHVVAQGSPSHAVFKKEEKTGYWVLVGYDKVIEKNLRAPLLDALNQLKSAAP